MIVKGDCVIALSYSGETPEILNILHNIHRLDIPLGINVVTFNDTWSETGIISSLICVPGAQKSFNCLIN